jgi:hypothetical protein
MYVCMYVDFVREQFDLFIMLSVDRCLKPVYVCMHVQRRSFDV